MSKIKQKIGKKILNNSGTLKHYKNKCDKLEKKVERLEKIANSDNILINSIFLDYELVPKPLLKNLQDLSLELLIFIDNVCKKHDIEWSMGFGSVLGVVRHQDFIPWDDDVDTFLLREDYNKLIKVLPSELERNNLNDKIDMHFRKREIDGKEVGSFLQIWYKHTDPYSVDLTGTDFFPYEFIKDYNGEDIGDYFEEVRLNFYRELIKGIDIEIVLKNYYDALNLSYEKQKHIIPGVEGPDGPRRKIKLKIYDTEEIIPFKRVKFKNVSLPVPKNTDYYLKNIYGNYWKIPKTVHAHGRINRVRKYPNIIEVYEDAIQIMKDVNENFK